MSPVRKLESLYRVGDAPNSVTQDSRVAKKTNDSDDANIHSYLFDEVV